MASSASTADERPGLRRRAPPTARRHRSARRSSSSRSAATTSSTRHRPARGALDVLAHGRDPQAERRPPAARLRRRSIRDRRSSSRRPGRVRIVPADSISSSAHRCSAWRRSTSGSWRDSARVIAMTCSAMARARTPRALVRTIGLATSSVERRWPTPAAGACTQRRRSAREPDRDRGTRRRPRRRGQHPPQRLAVPGVDEGVLRETPAGAHRRSGAAAPRRRSD